MEVGAVYESGWPPEAELQTVSLSWNRTKGFLEDTGLMRERKLGTYHCYRNLDESPSLRWNH